MIKKTLKGIAVGLALVMMALLVSYLNRSDPWNQLPGKRITGEEVAEPNDDWSFMEPSTRVTLEVRPSDPYSVDIRAYLHQGVLYLNSISPERRWTQYLHEDPNLRLKVENTIYQVRATWVEDPALVSEIQKAREQISPRLAQRTPQEKAQNGYFRIDSR
ncbi:MAG: hypothetical protein VYC91_04155 [Acidobacteriota bacterium]|nr:hypothetical protein [Acidobacteriota bacterium]